MQRGKNELALSVDEIVKATGGQLLSSGEGTLFTGVCTDSREARLGSIFFALKGERTDGHLFVPAAVEQGAALCVVENITPDIEKTIGTQICYILKVKDALVALQALAKYYRGKFPAIKMVGITGSSGKTTTAKRLCAAIAERYAEPLYLGTDDYFVERGETPLGPDGKPDFEGLGAIDLELFNNQMTSLIHGQEVDIPEFDFLTGTKQFGRRITKLRKNQIVVIEGIHSLNDILTENIERKDKFKLYISPLTQMGLDRHNRISTADARMLRRIVRDNQFRGYNAEATIESWPKVRAGESVNVFPYSSSADVVFNSSTVYETNLLRTYVEPLLQEIPETSPQYHEAQRILNFLRYFVRIESAEAVPEYSILREFIGRADPEK